MQALDPAIEAAIEGRAISTRMLVWVVARNRTTGLSEPAGFWTGDVDRVFTISGVAREYKAAGGLISVGRVVQSTGFNTVRVDLGFAANTPEVLQAVRQYDVKYAPIEIHKVFFDPATLQVIANPILEVNGIVDMVTENRGSGGGSRTMQFKIAPGMHNFTKKIPLRHSAASIMEATPADNFGRYFDLTGRVVSKWS